MSLTDDTRPAPGQGEEQVADAVSPPTTYPRPASWRRVLNAVRWRAVLLVVLLFATGVAAGLVWSRATSDPASTDAARVLERDLLPLVRDADAIWTGESDDRPSAARAVQVLRASGDTAPITDNIDAWTAAYDRILTEGALIEVVPAGRAVQRQFLGGLVVSRDALEVLERAAEAESTGERRLLAAEAIRLRSRSEGLTQSARTSLSRLADPGRADEDSDTSVPPGLPSYDELLTPSSDADS